MGLVSPPDSSVMVVPSLVSWRLPLSVIVLEAILPREWLLTEALPIFSSPKRTQSTGAAYSAHSFVPSVVFATKRTLFGTTFSVPDFCSISCLGRPGYLLPGFSRSREMGSVLLRAIHVMPPRGPSLLFSLALPVKKGVTHPSSFGISWESPYKKTPWFGLELAGVQSSLLFLFLFSFLFLFEQGSDVVGRVLARSGQPFAV